MCLDDRIFTYVREPACVIVTLLDFFNLFHTSTLVFYIQIVVILTKFSPWRARSNSVKNGVRVIYNFKRNTYPVKSVNNHLRVEGFEDTVFDLSQVYDGTFVCIYMMHIYLSGKQKDTGAKLLKFIWK